jgi:hypothetical protein
MPAFHHWRWDTSPAHYECVSGGLLNVARVKARGEHLFRYSSCPPAAADATGLEETCIFDSAPSLAIPPLAMIVPFPSVVVFPADIPAQRIS